MMTFSIFENLRSLASARPPLATFMISLIAMTISLFIVAFYVKHKSLLMDSIMQEDWSTFLKHFSRQKMCLNISETSHFVSEFPFSNDIMSYPAEVLHNLNEEHLQFLKFQSNDKGVIFKGVMNFTGWKPSCPFYKNSSAHPHVEIDEALSVSIFIPSVAFSIPKLELQSCVLVRGMSNYLPSSAIQNNNCHGLNVSGYVVGQIFPYNTWLTPKDRALTNYCGSEGQIQISLGSENASSTLYLREDEKLNIFTHLLQIGYFLLGLISIFLLLALIQGRNIIISSQHSLLLDEDDLGSNSFE